MSLFMTNNKCQTSDLLRELLAVPLSERIERVANDVLLHQDKFRTLAAHDLAEALGVPQPECPSGDWSFTRYAKRQSVEEYAKRYSSPSEFAEIVYALEDSVSPTRFNELLKEASRFDDVGPPKFDFLTREERELLEEIIVSDELEANSANGMNCLAHYDVEASSGDRLPFEAFVEDDGACIDLKTPYDFRDKKFVCLDNCLTDSW
jgi:hypothetical protein